MEQRYTVDLRKVPDWHTNPVELITLINAGFANCLTLEHHPELYPTEDSQVRDLVNRYLKPNAQDGVFFDGEYATVEMINVSNGTLEIVTGVARAFPYIASAWLHRNDPSKNTIRPLAVQVCVFDSETHNTILVERRPHDITDHPDKLSVLGGALKPGEAPWVGASRCLAKWGIKADPDSFEPLALTHEPADRIYCLVFTAEMPGAKIAEIVHNLRGKREVWAEPIPRYSATRTSLLTKRHVHAWNPLGYLAFACAAFTRLMRGEGEVRDLLCAMNDQLRERPYSYEFPMQKYLPKSGQQGA